MFLLPRLAFSIVPVEGEMNNHHQRSSILSRSGPRFLKDGVQIDFILTDKGEIKMYTAREWATTFLLKIVLALGELVVVPGECHCNLFR